MIPQGMNLGLKLFIIAFFELNFWKNFQSITRVFILLSTDIRFSVIDIQSASLYMYHSIGQYPVVL